MGIQIHILFFVFSMCKNLRHLASVTSVQKHDTCASTSASVSFIKGVV